MTPFPRNVYLIAPDSKEYASFRASLSPGAEDHEEGVLLKYASLGRFSKIACSLLLLCVSLGLAFAPSSPKALHPSGQIVVGCGFLLFLLICVKARFGDTWLHFRKQQLFIMRWRCVLPGRKITALDRKNILSVRLRTGPKISKTPRTHSVMVTLRNPKSEICIMADINSKRILWLTGMLSAWRKNGNIS